MSMPMKLFPPAEIGLTFVFPAAFFAPAELEEAPELPVPVAVAVEAVTAVMLPTGMPEGMPGETPAWPIVGNGALGSIFQPVGVCVGQAGTVTPVIEAAYADEATPDGVRVAHCAWRFAKSGVTGVGVPWRVYLGAVNRDPKASWQPGDHDAYPSITLVPSVTPLAKGP